MRPWLIIKINLAKIAHEFETETCSRCGGSGNYSYCQSYGTTCFKCRGKRRTFTKRGAAASKMYDTLASKPVRDLQPGDVIWNQDGVFHKSGWVKITQIVRGGNGCYSMSPDGGAYDELDSFSVVSARASHSGLSGGSLMRIKQSNGQRLAKRAQALRYQQTLNKAGK
jgi:hypothetical protein